MGYHGFDYGYACPTVAGAYYPAAPVTSPLGGFPLIVVLFILLIIVGTSFGRDKKC